MHIKKEIKDDNVIYLSFDGKLVFKKWLNEGYSIIFDHLLWEQYTTYSFRNYKLIDSSSEYHIECKLTLYSGEQGGRKTSIGNGYRPNHVFEYGDNGQLLNTFMGDFQFGEDNFIEPNTTHHVLARFLAHQPIEKYLNIGRKWWIHEGANVIGEAVMTKIELPEEE